MATLLRWILEIVLRSTGKHRATAPTASVPPARPPLPRRARFEVFDGDAVALVRPYLVAHEQRMEAHRQRERRRALVLATMGIDYLPEVAA